MRPIVKIEGKVGRLMLLGQFDFQQHRDFRQASQELLDANEVQEIRVDFDQVPSLDSSALGMLLLLKERAAMQKKNVVLTNCHAPVKQVFEMAQFQNMFTIQ